MLATAVIVFREVIEAALIISLVMAATTGIQGRNFWIAAGVAGGVVGAAIVATFASAISDLASGMGQEVFNAAIMFLAVLMLTWHCIWMSKHGRELAASARAVGKDVLEGKKPLAALAIVVGVAVLREGSEVVLFLYGIAVGGENQAGQMAIGGLFGLAGGAALGAAMYFGLLQIPTRSLFTVTNLLIILLASAMASQGVAYLVNADYLPAWGHAIWDTSALLSDKSLVGKMLHSLIGYTARPEGIQIATYVATFVVILFLMRQFGSRPAPNARPSVSSSARRPG
jgi:high-affinity iron transporter